MKQTATKRTNVFVLTFTGDRRTIIPYLYSAEFWVIVQGFCKSLGREKKYKTREKSPIRIICSVPFVGRIKYLRTTFSA